jgi:hypothetical protein
MSKRNELITKYERNLNLIIEFKDIYTDFLNKTETWDKPAFLDSSVTNRQYLTTLKQISEEEYSEQQHEAIKTVFIHEDAIENYIIGIDSQYENLKTIYNELLMKRKALQA